jgi:CheY-like chemotaxis protein
MRVLIVEDNAIIAMHLAMLVAKLGHVTCGTAVSAAEAIVQAATQYPDAVLMDIRLANGSSGVEAARELHARQGLRCIFVSANLDEPTKMALLPYEPIDFVGKPVLPILLKRALEKAEQSLTDL